MLSFINSTVESSAEGAKSSRLEWTWAFESHLVESTYEAPWDDTGKCDECNYSTMPPILLIGQQWREKTVAMMLAVNPCSNSMETGHAVFSPMLIYCAGVSLVSEDYVFFKKRIFQSVSTFLLFLPSQHGFSGL